MPEWPNESTILERRCRDAGVVSADAPRREPQAPDPLLASLPRPLATQIPKWRIRYRRVAFEGLDSNALP